MGSIKNVSYQEINHIYHSLPIYSKKDIAIDALDISKTLNKKPGSYIKEIFTDLEEKIVTATLSNEKRVLINYIKKNY